MGNTVRIIGILLIVFGVFAFTNHGINYTKQENIADIGSIHVTRENPQTIALSPILGGIAVAGGIILVLVGGNRKK
jgi:uncharacterized membrane protein HdeD (DUF308 family)